MKIRLVALMILGITGGATQAETADEPAQALETQIRTLVSQGKGRVTRSQMGTSARGRPMTALRLAAPGAGDDPDRRPALAIVAGLDGNHRVGVDVALALAALLAAEEPTPESPEDLLASHTIYILPAVNVDRIAWQAAGGHAAEDVGSTFTPDDADHDGRRDEDGSEDLNGDGMITQMRVADPRPGSGLEAKFVADPDDPRILRAPDLTKGEMPRYAVLTESRDSDGDGAYGEDSLGGIELDMNFPYRWPEATTGAGSAPLWEPEARALVDWMLAHNNIVATLVYGPHDNLVSVPAPDKFDASGKSPLGIYGGDKSTYDEVSKLFKEITALTGAEPRENAGSFWGWSYAQFGALTFTTPLWVRPDLRAPAPATPAAPAVEEPAVEEPAVEPATAEPAATQPSAPPAPPAPAADGKPRVGDAAWLAYSDTAAGGRGFVPWQAFDHRQLGAVEIGGFAPGFRHNAPPDELPRLAGEQLRFVKALLARFPALDTTLTARLAGTGVWRITLRIQNRGFFPTRSAAGVTAQRIAPMLARVELPDAAVISGLRPARIETSPGGGTRDIEWLVAGEGGSKVTVMLTSRELGDRQLEVVLEEDQH